MFEQLMVLYRNTIDIQRMLWTIIKEFAALLDDPDRSELLESIWNGLLLIRPTSLS